MLSDRQTDCRLRVKLGKAHNEHIYPRCSSDCVLQNSFWGDEQEILELLMRFTRGDVRDRIVSPKIDHGPSFGATKSY